MSRRIPAFIALGSNVPDRRERFRYALEALEAGGDRIAACSLPVVGPYELEPGQATDAHPPVLNAVVELGTTRSAEGLLERLQHIETEAGRVRGRGGIRTLDLDLLAWEDRAAAAPPVALPHPRALERAFVLQPWEEIAPLFVVPGIGDRPVVAHAAHLRARLPEAFRRLATEDAIPLPACRADVTRLETLAALRAWRRKGQGRVGVVLTMGALHAGHASLLRRARAECDRVLATIFVNPLQFGPGEDLDRYPRTLERDLEVLSEAGADAVYLPAAQDLYPEGFATRVVPAGPALGFEGERRPGHFEGVATVVLKLWMRTDPDRAYFGQKDAQQLAVIRRMAVDLDLRGRIVAGATLHAPDGLALSSRNRYLAPEERTWALALPQALETLAFEAASHEAPIEALMEKARCGLESVGLRVDYLDVVEPLSMLPTRSLEDEPALAVATVEVGRTRLLDNRWIACGRPR